MEGTPGKALAANTSEGVLANFFNSLLSKKTGGGGGTPGAGGAPAPGTRGGGSPQPDDCKLHPLIFSFGHMASIISR